MKKYQLTLEGVRADLTPEQVKDLVTQTLRDHADLVHESAIAAPFHLLDVTHVEDVTAGIWADNNLWQIACPMHITNGVQHEQPHVNCRYCAGSGIAAMHLIPRKE